MESTNKNRLLFLLQYLYENTNDDHKVSTSVLLDLIQENGMKVSRNTLANDIKTIASAGFDIISSNGPSNENLYHWGARPFDLPELKLLIDAVSSARFINQKMSNRLIEKLTSLASFHDKDSLKARIYPSDRIKADNRQKIVTFRVDRMRMPEILDEEAVPAPENFSAAEYANQAFMMYDGQEEMVILKCETAFCRKSSEINGITGNTSSNISD